MFWHENAKIPRHASQNPIAEGDFRWILTRNCEGTEQLRISYISIWMKRSLWVIEDTIAGQILSKNIREQIVVQVCSLIFLPYIILM